MESPSLARSRPAAALAPAIAGARDLLEEVWGYDSEAVSRTVDTHVRQLRRKLERDPNAPKHILTIRKTGYRLKR
jgi:DNA-binding response OmpR family regulator